MVSLGRVVGYVTGLDDHIALYQGDTENLDVASCQPDLITDNISVLGELLRASRE